MARSTAPATSTAADVPRLRSTGSPTVVVVHGIIGRGVRRRIVRLEFDSGSGADTNLCLRSPPLGKVGRFGRSTSADAVADLHRLLQTADVEPPYVLAGYSFEVCCPCSTPDPIPTKSTASSWWTLRCPSRGARPAEHGSEGEEGQNANDERINFYGAGATAAAVLRRPPEVPIAYLRALDVKDPKAWEEGAYGAALHSFMRQLPDGRLVEFETDHDMLIDIPADVADQIQRVLMDVPA